MIVVGVIVVISVGVIVVVAVAMAIIQSLSGISNEFFSYGLAFLLKSIACFQLIAASLFPLYFFITLCLPLHCMQCLS